jgi:hypothetical protein
VRNEKFLRHELFGQWSAVNRVQIGMLHFVIDCYAAKALLETDIKKGCFKTLFVRRSP